ncbi:hypothetical protein EYY98_18375 [Obesumbacterium proteus]|uniref:CDP-glycerol:polyglycerophosphate glycerophosphotransferase n=1 Tax=Hafnia alvei TaxID=569 RepID=A0A172X0E2_HAFAL|nr:CDP-glycerol:polyglycerophosphate glycerophosphotransferase [Hafnia alvei]TBL48090.1 hypothetical protein EYY98_18375 [Obesumbacterium proteus]
MRFIKVKITSLTYNLLGYFLSYFCKKDDKLWLFGSRDGHSYADNSKYLFEAMEVENTVNYFWVTKNKNVYHDLKDLINIEYFYSFKCQVLIAKAGVFITTHGINDISPYMRKNKLHVCLWHGLPLKKIGANTGASRGKNSVIYNLLSLFLFFKKEPDLFLSPSEFYKRIFKEAFVYKSCEFILAQYPRVSKLSRKEPSASNGKRILLYAPTFRDDVDESYYYLNQIIPHGETLKFVNEKLKKENTLMLIKPHPYIKLNKLEKELYKYEHVKYVNASEDVFDYLENADVLITDYSSIFFDYIILDRKMIFFAPDLEWYKRQENRGMYFDYEQFVPGNIFRDWASVIEDCFCERVTTNFDKEKIRSIACQYPDRNEEYIIQEIKSKLGYPN